MLRYAAFDTSSKGKCREPLPGLERRVRLATLRDLGKAPANGNAWDVGEFVGKGQLGIGEDLPCEMRRYDK